MLKYDSVRKMDLLLLPERVVKLNPTAAAILKQCDGKQIVDEIIQTLEKQYGWVGLGPDVLEFLRSASENGWIEGRIKGG